MKTPGFSSLFYIAALAVILVGKSVAQGDADTSPKQPPMVVLLGDSIRMNYQAAATSALKGKAQVWSPKDNCRHTVNVIENLERWLAEAGGEPEIVHINVGLHDLFLDGKTGKPRYSLETYEKNLRTIFARLDELSDAKVIFALTTVVNEADQAKSEGYQRVVRRNRDVDAYNAKAREVAAELDIAVNDLNQFMKATGPEKILRPSDGIHLSPDGCELMGKEVARVISGHLAK